MKDINFKQSEDALFLEEEHVILKEQIKKFVENEVKPKACLLYTSPSPRDA